jgi:hypothetical protein
MALKKRGFNVDRILNQQREEKLRVQAEAVRDREKALAAESARLPPAYTDPVPENQLVRSETSNSTAATASLSSTGVKTKSFLDKFRRNSRDLKSPPTQSLPSNTENREGGPSLEQMGIGESSMTGGMGGRSGGLAGGAGAGQSTKRVSPLPGLRCDLTIISQPI